MSSGEFRQVRYETNISWVVRAVVQPETLLLQSGAQTNVSSPLDLYAGLPSAIMRGGRKSIGIHSRQLQLRLSEGETPPPGYTGGLVVVPILRRGLWLSSPKGAPVVYLGRNWEVARRIPEQIN